MVEAIQDIKQTLSECIELYYDILRLGGELHKVLHENSKANIVREDGLPLRTVRSVMRYGGVEFGD